MNPLPLDVWKRGLPYSRYREEIDNNVDVFDEVYRAPAFTPADLDTLGSLPPLDVLVLGEDWCPDVYHTLPTWVRVAEDLPGWGLRVFPRDTHADVMDCFLWRREARRIPVYAFYDRRGHRQTWWSGRSREAQEWVDGRLAGRPVGELAPAEKSRFSQEMDEAYVGGFREANFREIVALLGAFFHVG